MTFYLLRSYYNLLRAHVNVLQTRDNNYVSRSHVTSGVIQYAVAGPGYKLGRGGTLVLLWESRTKGEFECFFVMLNTRNILIN